MDMTRSRRWFWKVLPCAVMLSLCLTASDGGAAGVSGASEPSGGVVEVASTSDTHAASVPMPAAGSSDEAYLSKIRADFTPANRAYWTTRLVLGAGAWIWGLAWILVFLFMGFSAGLRDFANRCASFRYFRILIYFAAFSVIGFVLDLPLAWLSDFQLERSYGLSEQSALAWFGDQLKGLALGVAMLAGVPVLQLAYWAIGRFSRWWLALAVGSVPLVAGLMLLQPILIDPIFNDFVPLKDEALRSEIVALAEKAGVPGRNVYEVDKSRQTKKFNAYVNGFGASQRIVLWDTTLQGLKQDEILFVMGHEMGHYRLGHVWKGMAMFSLLGFGVFFFSGLFMHAAVRRFGRRFGFSELGDIASLPLLSLSMSLMMLVTQPLLANHSRSIEHDADTFALEVTRLNDAGARAFIQLGSQNRANPEPPKWLEWAMYSHPALLDRVKHALAYRPWEKGEANRLYRSPGASRSRSD